MTLRLRSSRWRRVLAAAVVVVLVFGVLTARLFVWPTQGMPTRVSAIVMLAGPGDRLSAALDLARQHRAPMLVVSQGQHGYGGPCPARPPGVTLICFSPDPGNTRGEAEFVGRLARRYHWISVVLVTSRSQDTRARVIVGRCFGGHVFVITGTLPLSDWPYEVVYGWGALLKALVLYRGC
jgi:uncharacterized SAM-binding protein YcdF (DUF218 family)